MSASWKLKLAELVLRKCRNGTFQVDCSHSETLKELEKLDRLTLLLDKRLSLIKREQKTLISELGGPGQPA